MPLEEIAHRAEAALKAHVLATCPGQVAEVRLHGSRARGDVREESDLDILVLTTGDDAEVRRAASEPVQAVCRALDYPFPISSHVMAQSHFQGLLRRERLYACAIVEEGIVV